jgi:dipeptide transport system substrate-binding protein
MNSNGKAIIRTGLVALLCAYGSMAVAAKTLVFCSEASPEGFNPQFFTTGVNADATSVPIYNG